LIGRLEYSKGRRFEIRYDLLDSRPLQFREGSTDDTPYIRAPFPPHPPAPAWENGGPEKRLRPATLWAAMHLAAKGADGRRRPVLVFAAQHPEWYAKDFLELLETSWVNKGLPDFFEGPSDQGRAALWQECLATCQDYFGSGSYEYRLLQKGIVLHHGKMPGRMARLLVEVVTERIVSLVVATSTLSEGVNLPFEMVLLPTLTRGREDLDVREFANLVGRAGRPGSGTEGRALVLLGPGSQRTRLTYQGLIGQLVATGSDVPLSSGARSSLAELIQLIERQWTRVSGSTDEPRFLAWLESTAPLVSSDGDPFRDAALTLDALDKILVASISETEALAGRDLSPTEIEERLKEQWQRSYAHYASAEEARLAHLFVARGKALRSRIYESSTDRRRLYMTSLAPRPGTRMLSAYPEVRALFETGRDYATWNADQRFQFISAVAQRLVLIPGFELRGRVAGGSWEAALRWWLDVSGGPRPRNESAVLSWYDFISKNFIYRFNWALGSIIALAVNEAHGGELRPTSLEEWPQTGLPWVVFWMKELVTWGTLEPVAAYLLSQKVDLIRVDAEARARAYYGNPALLDNTPDERLRATTIRDWVLSLREARVPPEVGPALSFEAGLVRDFTDARQNRLRVVPVTTGGEIQWVDPGGFPLAASARPTDWHSSWLDTHDFTLDSEKATIEGHPYVLP